KAELTADARVRITEGLEQRGRFPGVEEQRPHLSQVFYDRVDLGERFGGRVASSVLFFFAGAPVSTGFGASSFKLYFVSDVLTVAARANRAFASDSAFGVSVFASV